MQGHTDDVNVVAFSHDNFQIVSGSSDNTARLWYTDYNDLIEYACSNISRDLHDFEREQYNITMNPDAINYDTCPQFENNE